MNIAIIGAGPAGLSCAFQLLKNGIAVDLYESNDTVGGLAKSLSLWNEKVEMGPHFLSATLDPEVKNLVMALLPAAACCHYNRQTRIVLGKKMIAYPPSPLNIALNIGIANSFTAAFHVFLCLLKPNKPDNELSFEDYIRTYLGDHVYNIFFKGYTEKLWGIPCSEIRADYGTSLIGFGNLTIASLFKKIFTAKDNNKHTKYIHPIGGMNELWNALLKNIGSCGGQVYLATAIQNIDIAEDGKGTIHLPGGIARKYDYIVSTIPDGKLLQYLPGQVPAIITEGIKKLAFRNAILLYLKLDNTDFIQDNNLYLHNNNVRCVRITNYNRFKNATGAGIIMIEYWVNEDDAMWQAGKEQILQTVKTDLQILFHEKYNIVDTALFKLSKAFPVPDMQSVKSGAMIKNYLHQFDKVIRIGRASQNNFNFGMEDALKEGIVTANKLAAGRG